MSRLSLFNSPLLLGFDQFERALDQVTKAARRRLSALQCRADRRERAAHHPCRRRLHHGRPRRSRSRATSSSCAASRPTTRTASISIAASPRASFSAASCSPRASRWRAPWLDNGLLNIDLVRRAAEGRVRRVAIRRRRASGTGTGNGSAIMNLQPNAAPQFTAQEFAHLGVNDIAYVKRVVDQRRSRPSRSTPPTARRWRCCATARRRWRRSASTISSRSACIERRPQAAWLAVRSVRSA